MNLLISLRSEIVKLKRSSLLYMSIFVAAIVPLISFFEMFEDETDFSKTLLWNQHFGMAQEILSILFLPLFIILTSTLLLQTEYRNNTWKQVLASPQKLINVFVAKFIILQLLVILFLIFFNVWLLVEAVAVNLIIPDAYSGVNVSQLLLVYWQIYISVLAITAIQFWFALRFKNFIAPLAIGFLLWFMAPIMIFEMKWPFAQQYPFSFSILTIFPKYKASIPTIQLYSLGYAVLFLVIGFIDFKRKKIRTG